jgi:hypothetical protein
MHFRADIVADQVLGTAVASALLDIARFDHDVQAARAEMTTKGFAK